MKTFLPLKNKQNYSIDNWIVSPCNTIVTKYVYDYKNWDKGSFVCIYGDHGSGKTHMLNIFKDLAQAKELTAENESSILVFERHKNNTFFAFDNIEQFEENWLFSMYNILRENNKCALFTSCKKPNDWTFKIKDLDSRIRSTLLLNLENPDEETIKHIIIKQLNDLGVSVENIAIEYLVNRIPRSFEDIKFWVKTLDEESLGLKRKITINLIRTLLERFSPPDS